MFQQTWETVIVFRDDEDKTVGSCDRGRELRVLKRFTGVVHADGNFPDVDQFRLDIAAF